MPDLERDGPAVTDSGEEAQITQGPMSKLSMYITFGIGMVLMVLFVPRFESWVLNFAIGAAVGLFSAMIGSAAGSLLDKKEDRQAAPKGDAKR